MKEKKRIYIFAYVVFALVMIFFHYFIVTGTNDDAWFAEMLDKYSLPEYLKMRYNVWTSRIFIETGEVCLNRINPWVWKGINIFIIIALVYECSEIWGRDNKLISTVGFMLLVLLFPASMLSSAGWISTTLNYLWSTTAGIFTILLLYKWIQKGRRISIIEYILGVLACLYCCCQEQVVAVLLVTYILYGLYCKLYQHKIPVIWWIFLIIAIGFLIFIFLCPGNANRTVLETASWFPEFENLKLHQKLLIGYLTTFSYFVSCGEYNVIFLLFSYVLAAAVWEKTSQNQKCFRGIALYPFLVTFLGGYVGRIIMNSRFSIGGYWFGLLQNDRLPEFSGYSTWHIVLECIIFFTILCAIVCSLYILFDGTFEFYSTTVILFAGLCSRFIIGLSPTVYVSGSRTAMIAHVCFMIMSIICIQKGLAHMKDRKRVIYYIPFCVFALVSTLYLGLR